MHETFAFISGALDRAAHLRAGEGVRQHKQALTLILWRGSLLIHSDGRPVLAPLDHSALSDTQDDLIFLGLTPAGPRFAVDLRVWQPPEPARYSENEVPPAGKTHPAWPEARFDDVRGMMPLLSKLDGECIATGKALVSWHAKHGFCANCGNATIVESSGWVRRCPSCGTSHFPRTDPVVIMLISREDRLLLGRGPGWPEGVYSLLAGFVEPGETIETAVRREVYEESQVKVGSVQYLASQPWPFPTSLMFGCYGEALTDEIVIDRTELDDARWAHRDEVLAMLAGQHPEMKCPLPGSIASSLIEAWANNQVAWSPADMAVL